MKREVKIGVFTVFTILCAWGGIRFLSGSDIFGNERYYYAKYEQISGVQNSSPIFIKGVKVGSVVDISLEAKSDADVVLKLAVSGDYPIPKNSEAKIFSGGIMSPKAIEIVLGDSAEYLESGDNIASSFDTDIFDIAGSEVEVLSERINVLTSELSTTLKNVNVLLESNTLTFKAMMENTEALTRNLNTVVEKNEQNLNRTLSGLAELSETIGNNKESIDSIILNITALSKDLSDSNIASSLSSSLDELTTLLATINEEEGTIGKFMSDEQLYGNLVAASADLDSLFVDMKRAPSRYIHFSVFGRNAQKEIYKQEKRARKDAEEEAKDAANDARKAERRANN